MSSPLLSSHKIIIIWVKFRALLKYIYIYKNEYKPFCQFESEAYFKAWHDMGRVGLASFALCLSSRLEGKLGTGANGNV